MNKYLQISQVLVFYDIPELFVCIDAVDTQYLSILVESQLDGPLYYSTPISARRLAEFISGKTDLRSVYESPETSDLYSFILRDGEIMADRLVSNTFPEELLPEAGFLLNESYTDNKSIVDDVFDRKNAVVHLALSDNQDNHSIDADDLGQIVALYSTMLENAYKKGIAEHKIRDRKFFLQPSNYRLRAFAGSPGSFNLHLYSTSQRDLFGNCMVEYGLEKVDQVLTEYANDDELVKNLQSIKGHAVSSLKSILKKIIDDDLILTHKWFAPNRKQVEYRRVDTKKAQKVFDILNQSEELAEEIKEIVGVFVQADVERGTWRMKSLESNQEFIGRAKPDDLKGLTLESVTYKVVCQEIIEEFKVSEKEKKTYIFKSAVEIIS